MFEKKTVPRGSKASLLEDVFAFQEQRQISVKIIPLLEVTYTAKFCH